MPHQYLWRRFKDFMKYRVLHMDDTPHQIALGAALAIFVAWTPTIGVQMLLALTLATLFRANKAITIPAIWISNPITVAPIFWCNWKLGDILVGSSASNGFHVLPQWTDSASLTAVASRLFDPRFWIDLSGQLLGLGIELWIGSVIVGVVAAGVGYAAMYVFVRQYRLRYKPELIPRVREAGKKLAQAARQRTLRKRQAKANTRPCKG